MTDPTLSNKREDILPNVVLNNDTSLENPTAGEAPTKAVDTGSNPPHEPEAEKKDGDPIPISPEVTSDESDTDKENKKTKKRVNTRHNEDAEQGAKAKGHVDIEVNVQGNIDISVTVNVNKCPLQNLKIRRCNYFN